MCKRIVKLFRLPLTKITLSIAFCYNWLSFIYLEKVLSQFFLINLTNTNSSTYSLNKTSSRSMWTFSEPIMWNYLSINAYATLDILESLGKLIKFKFLNLVILGLLVCLLYEVVLQLDLSLILLDCQMHPHNSLRKSIRLLYYFINVHFSPYLICFRHKV